MLDRMSENKSEGVDKAELREVSELSLLFAQGIIRGPRQHRTSASRPRRSRGLTAKIRFGGDEKDTRISGAGILGEDEGGGRDEEERKKRKEKVKRRESGVDTEESNSERIERDFTKG